MAALTPIHWETITPAMRDMLRLMLQAQSAEELDALFKSVLDLAFEGNYK